MRLSVNRVLPWLGLAVCSTLPAQMTITTPATLPPGVVGRSYSQTFTASGGSGKYNWTWVSAPNTIPALLGLSGGGVLSGTPNTVTSTPASFTIRVEDKDAPESTATKTFHLEIAPALAAALVEIPSYRRSSTGNLPLTSGSIHSTGTARDSNSPAETVGKELEPTIAPVLEGPSISTNSPLPPATAGRAYTSQISAAGGLPPNNWSLQGSPPAWVSISTGGLLSGTPPAAGTATIRVRVSDLLNRQDMKDFSLTINAAPVITTASPISPGVTGQAYSQALAATGGTAPRSWSLTGNPAWLTINAATGALTGTPTAAGTVNFTARVTDANQAIATKVLQLPIAAPAPPTITTATLPNWTVGRAYSQTVQATGGAGGYTWSVSAGQLPAGLGINATSGAITGTPSAAGASVFTIRVSDSLQAATTKQFSLTINAAPAISTVSLPNGTVGQSYSASLAASGGTGTLTWSVASGSALPAGLSLNPASGAISGSPTAAGTANVNFQVADAVGATATRQLMIAISGNPVVISTTSLPAGSVNQPYAATLQASGGTGTGYRWSLAPGSVQLPAGLTLNPTTGAISGTPTVPGTTNFTVRVTDSADVFADRGLSLAIAGPALTIVTSALPQGMRGVRYSSQVQAEGGSGAGYTFSLAAGSGSLQAGLTLAASGLISGTPEQAGSVNLLVEVRDGAGTRATKALSLVIAESNLSITTQTLPRATQGTAYSASLTASGGTQPYTWRVTGARPPGVNLNGSALSGTPTVAGTFSFTVIVQDAQAVIAQTDLSITVVAFTITTSTLPRGTTNTAYSAVLEVENGTAPVTFSLQTGTLPAGLTLNANGQISGTPTQSGTFNVTIQARDAGGNTASKPFSLTIASDLSITADSLPGGSVGMRYAGATLRATGGSGTGYAFALTTGTLPPGLTLSPAGAISGTPTGTAGTSTFTVQVTDSSNATAQRQFSIVIGAGGGNPSITTSALNAASAGTAYSATLAATGGTPPYTWSVAPGSSLPAGLTLNPATGVISGTPSAVGNYSFTVRVQDAANPSASATRVLTLMVAPSAPAITTTSLPAASVGTSYNATLISTGGAPPLSWSIAQGELPAGIALVSSSGQLSGIPTIAGTHAFTIQLSDSTGASMSRAFTIVVAPALTVTTTALPGGTTGVAYTQTLAATGGTSLGYTWFIPSGALPGGLTLASASGVISGTPASEGTSAFTVQVVDSAGNGASRQLSITVSASLNITTNTLPGAAAGAAYNQRITASGGMPPLQWSVSGALPPGLTLNAATGEITGTAQGTGNYPFRVQAQDANGVIATKDLSITVSEGLSILTETALPNAAATAPYAQTLRATGGTPPYRWSVSVGSLPAALSLDSDTGAISGTVTTGGNYSFIVQVTDSAQQTATKAFTLSVAGLITIVTPSNLPAGTVGLAYNQTLEATGGSPPYTWAAAADSTLPPGISISSTGSLTGTPTSSGSSAFTVQVTDSQNVSTTKPFSVTVAGNVTVTTTQLPEAMAGVAYAQALNAAGGQPPYTWSLSAGNLPAGLTLGTDGIVTGTPTAGGNFTFQAQVADGGGNAAVIDLTLVVRMPEPPKPVLSGVSDTLEPASQPRVNVTLSSAFPAPITGTVSLTFEPNAVVPADDPALLFTNGSRTVQFTVPPNTTQAQFATPLAVQVGTVAGKVTLRVQLRSGEQEMSDLATVQTATIPRSAPILRQVTARRDTQSSQIVVDIVGFATSREVTRGTFVFAPRAGVALQTTEVPVALGDTSKAWFEGDESKRFGSLFTLSQRFTVTGNLNDIAGVTVTLANSDGSSQAVVVSF